MAEDMNERAMPVLRVDKFVVPPAAREEFLARVRQTHEILRRLDGFVRDYLLEQPVQDGASRILTIVEWRNQAAVDRAVEVIGAEHRRTGFDPRQTAARLGIVADIGLYTPLVGTA